MTMRLPFFRRRSWAPLHRPQRGRPAARTRCLLSLEPLESRLTPAYSGSFSGGVLTVTSNDAGDTMILSADRSGHILLNDSLIRGRPTLSNTGRVKIIGNGGDDTASLAGLGGWAGRATLRGGDGNDTLT